MRKTPFILLLIALGLWAAPAQAQTYYPFGSVNVGTTSTNIRVGPFGCYVGTSSPTYTTGQIHPCSLTTTGGMRMVLIDASTGTPLTPSTDATHGSTVSATGPQGMAGAVAFGSNPTAVTAGQAVRANANRAGVPFVLGGHPNVKTLEAQIEDADGAQTNAAIVTVSTGTKIVVTQVTAHCDTSTTNPTNVVVGFATSTLPSRAHTGASGILIGGDGIAPGGGITRGDGSGIIGVGADDEDVRITTEDPAGGACSVEVSYFTIES